MRVFISWSGERSKAVGELLDDWLQCVLQAINPWMSSKDIDRGSFWFSEINDQLKDATIGIICLTQDNKEKPWILFEAGALAKGLSSSRVCTFLVDLSPADIEDPLAQFNHTMPDKEGVWSLVRTLNNALGEKALKEKVLEKVFETYWPQFNEEFNKILSETPQVTKVVKRKIDDILNELLYVTRSMEKRIRAIEYQKQVDERIVGVSKNIIPKSEADTIICKMIEEGNSYQEILSKLEGIVPINYLKARTNFFINKFKNEICEEADS